MNYSQFLNMIPEATLMLALVLVFFADFALHKSERKTFVLGVLTGALLLCQLVPCFLSEPATAFGGMYVSSPIVNVMKTILTLGTFIVVVMSQKWMASNTKLSGEFYMLVLSTLLGMYMMMSAGHFLLFFLGLEMASVPMACLVAFDRYKKKSAEAAAKYILTATFSSGVMLYGISFLYGAVGTLYFDDMANAIELTPLSIMGMVFFFSGLGFKISLVPFHFWTADTYEGAPTPVTGYLSVVSKGAATLTLAIILMHVFGRLVEYWEPLLWIVIMLTITVGNLFAIRQTELKRFMAFSSISQAGYIMLAVIGNSAQSLTALTFYVLVYVAANMAVFTVISAVEENNGGRTDMAAYNGLYATNPKLSLLMTLALFSLAGIPPFAGMFSKFFVFMAAVGGHENAPFWPYFVVFIALINTVVSLYYYLLIVKAMYITKTDEPLPAFKNGAAINWSLAICTVGILLFGVCSCIYEWIDKAAVAL
ncbi:NADH-quinone oxidoreductase subunit N [Prevotella sp. E13-17]|uniref:NADH-quinone oxidoreductase subunit N n=1 Tax=Prevotella sp. E13-17 TaxID=2913616 RepID=UPI001EDBF69A|nr:NADH-quinone oxidoreductase subunit N [Prevotella sp. E13-17]UKK50109.1 NADH-quinone oxidoreductase subunit N [Prevotella sp. E13-17]